MAQLMKKSMRLFGMPYQFTGAVDPRIPEISTTVGRKFIQNIVTEGPVCTIIPGVPAYLPNKKDKVSTTNALLKGAANGFSDIKNILGNNDLDKMRLYDFKRSYTEYMKYVNILCRAGATFLELDDTSFSGGSFQRYDWRNYRQTSDKYSDVVSKSADGIYSLINKVRGSSNDSGSNMLYETTSGADGEDDAIDSIEEAMANYNFVQFYCDPDSSGQEDLSNSTSESQLKSMFDSGGNMMKELAFMMNSGSMDSSAATAFIGDSASALSSGVDTMLGSNSISGAMKRFINLGGEVIKGDNIVMPDIYQSSQYSKSYSLTVHLKSPYGTKLGYYLDIFVPMMHLLALAAPRQATANSYSSPFLIKAYVDGLFSCNLGMVQSFSVSRATETRNVDGLPMEVDVSLNIADLYSDISMSPQSDKLLFANNSSLVEYLATNCGLSLVTPQLKTKLNFTINSIGTAITNVPANVTSSVREKIDNMTS